MSNEISTAPVDPAALLVTAFGPPVDGERFVVRLDPKGLRGRFLVHGLSIMFDRGVCHDVPGSLARTLATKRLREDAAPGVDQGPPIFQIFCSSADVEAWDLAIADAERLRLAATASAEVRASSIDLPGSARHPIVSNG